MVRSRSEGYSQLLERPGAYLHPSSDSFGLADRRSIERSFLATGRSLNDNLLRLTEDLRTGSVGVQGYTNRAAGHIRAAYFTAFALGAISLFPFYTLTSRDVYVLDRALDEETGFLSRFARDFQRGYLYFHPIIRIRLHVLSLVGIFEAGRVEAMPGGPLRWRLGDKDHCIECEIAASGGPYQRDRTTNMGLTPLPGIPSSGSVCLGFTRCGCKITMWDGTPLPNEGLGDQLREGLTELLNGDYPASG